MRHRQLSFLCHTMPSLPRIPSVRARLQQRESSMRKSPAPDSPDGSLGAVSRPPRVGIYGPILRGRHSKSLEASILRSRDEHHSSKSASAHHGADENQDDKNNGDFDDCDDAKMVSSVRCHSTVGCCQFCNIVSGMSYVFVPLI